MKRIPLLCLVATSLAGCHKADVAGGGPGHDGRYLGVGSYPAGELWQHVGRKDTPGDRVAATLADDDQIIVTVDSRTGEVRQCGNLSGYCIGSNPWKTPASPAPAILTKHSADLGKEHEGSEGSK